MWLRTTKPRSQYFGCNRANPRQAAKPVKGNLQGIHRTLLAGFSVQSPGSRRSIAVLYLPGAPSPVIYGQRVLAGFDHHLQTKDIAWHGRETL